MTGEDALSLDVAILLAVLFGLGLTVLVATVALIVGRLFK